VLGQGGAGDERGLPRQRDARRFQPDEQAEQRVPDVLGDADEDAEEKDVSRLVADCYLRGAP
jgi:hypothetical protein